MDGGGAMTGPYVFTYKPEAAAMAASMRASPPAIKVRGSTAAKLLRLLHCILLVWSTAFGIGLSYLAIFGSLFITLPVMVRAAVAIRANRGRVRMVIDVSGLQTQGTDYQSALKWSGFEAVTRSKPGFVLWFGGNRPSIPFSVFESPAQIETSDKDVQHWLEVSR